MKLKLLFTLTLVTLISIFSLFSCNKQEKEPVNESLSLKAPSGINIANSIEDLKLKSSEIVISKFGNTNQNFDIIDIKYFPVQSGYAAIVTYRLENGLIGNYGISKGVKSTITSTSISVDNQPDNIQSLMGTPDDDSGGGIRISCVRTGECPCLVEGVYHTNTGTLDWRCSCEQCDAIVSVIKNP